MKEMKPNNLSVKLNVAEASSIFLNEFVSQAPFSFPEWK